MVDITNLVSMTHRMAQAEELAEQLREHLGTLPVKEVEGANLIFQLDCLVDTLRAEIQDWQKLSMTGASIANKLVGYAQAMPPKMAWDTGGVIALIIQRSPTVEAMSEQALDQLRETWPHLGIPLRNAEPPVTKSTNE